jgi:hypothetical protein
MAFGLGAFVFGLVLVIAGTMLRASIMGSIMIILGSAITAVGVIFLGLEGLTRQS